MNLLFNLEHLLVDSYDRSAHIPLADIRGCAKAESSDRCSYCSIDHSVSVMDPEVTWKQIEILYEKGFNFFFHTGDSFFVGDYPERLLKTRPESLRDMQHRIYVRPEEVTRKNLSIMNECIKLNLLFLRYYLPAVFPHIRRIAGKGIIKFNRLKSCSCKNPLHFFH